MASLTVTGFQVTVTVGMVEEGGGEDGFNERLEEWGLSERIVGSRTNDRRAGLWPSGAQTSCFATAAAAGPGESAARFSAELIGAPQGKMDDDE